MIGLPEVKEHLFLDTSFTEDDKYLERLIPVALGIVENCLGYKEVEFISYNVPQPLIDQAMLVSIATLYRDREITSNRQTYNVAFGVKTLLSPYILDFFE